MRNARTEVVGHRVGAGDQLLGGGQPARVLHVDRDAALAAAGLQRVQQRDHDAGAGRADRVAQRAGAAVHVDDLVRNLQLRHQGHRHHGEGLVHFPQVHVRHLPAGLGQQLLRGADRGGGEPLGLLRVGGVADDARQRLHAQSPGRALGHHHQRRGAVVDAGAGGGGDGAVLLERGLERGNLVQLDLARALVDGNHALAGTDGVTELLLDELRRA
mgnify:CR=1 FL=1